jgi:uncharacterized protein YjiS (DUF1127 family)
MMQMHTAQSLYEIHGLSSPRQRRRSRLIARLLVARIVGFAARIKQAIEDELAARQAIEELASMNDHMLCDLGISRGEIENAVRRPGPRSSFSA